MALSNEAEYVLRTIEERGIKFIRLWFTDERQPANMTGG